MATLLSYLYPSALPKYLRTHGEGEASWALVTGATDGIGFGFAEELCTRGFNVILHGRNQSKLDSKCEELQKRFPKSKLRIVVADASSFASQDIVKVIDQIKDLPITVLVNNVGGTGVLDANFKSFDMHTAQEVDALLSLNVSFPIQLTAALWPLLKQNTPSLVLNVGSQAFVGVPFLPVYSATKGAIHAWSRALAVEQETYDTKIEVLEILVGSVQSQQNQTPQPTFFVPSSREMARTSLERVGGGLKSVPGYFPHWIQLASRALLPEWVVDWATVKFLKPLSGKKERVW